MSHMPPNVGTSHALVVVSGKIDSFTKLIQIIFPKRYRIIHEKNSTYPM
jgi:hypothetical protein